MSPAGAPPAPPPPAPPRAAEGARLWRRLGNVLIGLGVVLLGYAALWQLGVAPGSRVSVPEPVALERAGGAREVAAAPPAMPIPTSTPAPSRAPEPAAATPQAPATVAPLLTPAPLTLVAPDVSDRRDDARYPPPGVAVRLAIPAIKLDTEVRRAGIVPGPDGAPIWPTLPFVAVHYADDTALVGARGNAVIAGHVVTLREGNVFRNLYQVDLGDTVQVWDERDREHDFEVEAIKLVPPSDVSVMERTSDRRLTLITCGGTFDPVRREFSDRLVVVAAPLPTPPR